MGNPMNTSRRQFFKVVAAAAGSLTLAVYFKESHAEQVAKLAGIPREVLAAAKDKLQVLETGSTPLAPSSPSPSTIAPRQPDLFAPPLPRCVETLKGINPDDLTPKLALELLYRLKSELN